MNPYLVMPGVEPTLHALLRFRLFITLLFPVLGKPAHTNYNDYFRFLFHRLSFQQSRPVELGPPDEKSQVQLEAFGMGLSIGTNPSTTLSGSMDMARP